MVPVRPGVRDFVSAYADVNVAWAILYAGVAGSGRLGGFAYDAMFCVGCGMFLLTWWVRMHRRPGFRPMDVLGRGRR